MTTPNSLNRYMGSFVALAVGDALGMATESKPRDAFKEKVQDYKPGYLAAGSYTDDTHHSLLLAESLLENDGFDQHKYTQKLLVETDLKRGYGPSLIRFFKKQSSQAENLLPY